MVPEKKPKQSRYRERGGWANGKSPKNLSEKKIKNRNYWAEPPEIYIEQDELQAKIIEQMSGSYKYVLGVGKASYYTDGKSL